MRTLLDEKGKLVAKQRELHTSLEATGEWPAESEAEWVAISREIDEKSRRFDQLKQMQEIEKENAAQREAFVKMIGTGDAPKQDLDARIRSFMRASLPGSLEYAPKAIDVKMSDTFGVQTNGREMVREYHTLSKLTNAAGGYLVPSDFSRTLMVHLVNMAAVRQTNARVLRTSNGQSLPVPKTTSYGASAIATEGAALAASDPAFGQVTLGAFKYGQIIQLSRELVEDEAVDIVGFLAENAGRTVGLANGADLVVGGGSTAPQGAAVSPVQGIGANIANAAALAADNLIDLFHGINGPYRANGYWLMNDLTLAQVRKFKDTTNQYLWQPGLQAGEPDSLLGRPIVTDPNVLRAGAGAALVLFGDFSLFYTIRDVDGIRFERSDDYAFGNDLISFRVIFRSDAKQILNDTTNSAVKAIILTA